MDTTRQMTGAQLAIWLRSGPLRPMLDRVVQSAAESTGMPFMVLGIRHTDFYEIIASHGIPLSHYADRVPASVLGADHFAREIEVGDLQKQSVFWPLTITPIAKTWHYGCNTPVKLQEPLSDGVIALSGAHSEYCELGGSVISTLRRHARFISDMIWLSKQVQLSQLVNQPEQMVGSVLQSAAAGIAQPVCIIDGHRRILGQSSSFVSNIEKIGGAKTRIGEPLAGPWLGSELEQQIDLALAEGRSMRMVSLPGDGAENFILDIFSISFATVGRFAVVSLTDQTPLLDQFRAGNAFHEPAVASWADPCGPVSRFLLETTIVGERLHQRKDTHFLGVRRWRSSIRQYQVAALRALKESLPNAFVQTIAAEMVAAIKSVHGSHENCVVVPVPCGHSGENCLSHRLAHAVANLLQLPVIEAFETMKDKRGSSHPRKNGRRAPMKLREKIEQPVILIDDVSTSGSHINEAATLLRKSAPSVWPVVWITS